MRFLLTLFCLGTFTLSGCAEGLTGPDSAPDIATGISTDAPAPRAPAPPDLYTTWVGADKHASFALSFTEKDPASEISAGSGTFSGTGVCRLASPSPASSSFDCYVSTGIVQDGIVEFVIESQEQGVIAKASGAPSPNYNFLDVALVYDDGTESSIEFSREESLVTNAEK